MLTCHNFFPLEFGLYDIERELWHSPSLETLILTLVCANPRFAGYYINDNVYRNDST